MIRTLFTIGIVFFFVACTNSSGKSMAVNTGTDTGFYTSASSKILIELFTSQGCSSCPSADKLMGSIMTADTNVIALSFHVDYWDRLGWKDVFSSRDYTLRQQEYVRALHAESLYTPQAVIQGRYEMVGSNRTHVLDAINKTKAQTATQQLSANASVNGININVNYRLSPIQASQQLIVALVQNKATTAVAKGENAGAQLADYNVVRSLQKQPANTSGSLQLMLPADLKKENASVVLFTQDQQTNQVATVTLVHL